MLINRSTIVSITAWLLLFLYALNFNDMAIIWLAMLLIPTFLLTEGKVAITKDIVFLFLATGLYFVFGNELTLHACVRFVLGPALFFLFGYTYVKRDDCTINEIMNCVYSLSFGFALQQFLTLMINFSTAANRYIPDFWSGQIIQPTNFNSRGIITVAITYYVLCYEKRKLVKCVHVFFLGTVLLSSIMTASRTNIYFAVLFFIIDFLVDVFVLNREKLNRLRTMVVQRRTFFTVLIIILAAVLIWFLYSEQIISWFNASALMERQESDTARFSLSNDPRWERWVSTIKLLIENPMGNPEADHAHNLILDVGRVSGIIPMIFMLICVILQIRRVIMCCGKKYDERIKVFSFSIASCILASFMIEPVLEGRPYIYIGSCMIMGIILAFSENHGKMEWKELEEYSFEIEQ